MAGIGLLAAAVVVRLFGLEHAFGGDGLVFAGVAAWVAVLGWGLGGALAGPIARGADPWPLGLVLALLTVVLGALAPASIYTAVHHVGPWTAQVEVCLRLLGGVLLVGAAPMVALGLGYAASLQRSAGRLAQAG